MLGVGIYFLRVSIKGGDKEGIIGMMMLVIAAVIMIIFYGLFYTLTLP
jgi:hypothetical protein